MCVFRGKLLRGALAVAWLGGVCGCGPGSVTPGRRDGAARDSGSADTTIHGDAAPVDGGADAGVADAPPIDAALADAGQSDGLPQTDVLPQTDGPPVLVTIVVAPRDQVLEVDLNTPATQGYTARGYYSDLTDLDVTSQAAWQSSNPALGSFSGATLNVPGIAAPSAAVTSVTATIGTITGNAQLTVVAYRRTGPQIDFFFSLPYNDPAGNQQKPLAFTTNVQSLDVFFAMDVTGSMFGEISNLQTSLTGANGIVPQIQAQIPDTQFGAGAFADFPINPYGSVNAAAGWPVGCGRGGLAAPDQPFYLFQAITANTTLVQTAVDLYANGPNAPIGCGLDLPESMIEALYQVATGEGLTGPSPTNVAPNHAGIGGVGYRHGAMPVVVPVTDSMSHAPGESGVCGVTGEAVTYAGEVLTAAHARLPTKDALQAICAKVVGVASIDPTLGACTGLADEEDFARATGAVVPPAAWDVPARPGNCAAGQCCTGLNGAGRAPDAGTGLCPLVFQVNAGGTGLGTSVVAGLKALTQYAPFDVTSAREGTTAGIYGEPVPPPHTTADFIKLVQPVAFQKPAPPPVLPDPTMDATSFHNVTPGTIVSFRVEAYNDFVPQTIQPQLFRAVIRILAGGCTDLDQREVFILVPPRPPN